jgi:hypothetical protein
MPQLSSSLNGSRSSPTSEPGDTPSSHPDILEAIMDVCETAKLYGTIALIGSLSKHHRSVVQPRLARIKKRVVLSLDDYWWRDRDNDKNIEYVFPLFCTLGRILTLGTSRIIHCTRTSPFPISIETSEEVVTEGISYVQRRLKPSIIVCEGQPHTSVLTLWTRIFPTVKKLVCSENIDIPLHDVPESLFLGNIGRSDAGRDERLESLVKCFIGTRCNELGTVVHPAQLQYRTHIGYCPITLIAPASYDLEQPRYYVIKGCNEAGNLILDQRIHQAGVGVTQEYVLKDIVCSL